MKLTRRDALEALAAGTVIAGGTLAASEAAVQLADDRGDSTLSTTDVETLVAVAETVYPSAVSVDPSFVETYVQPLGDERTRETARAVADLNRYAETRYGNAFHEVDSASRRDAMLRSMGVNRAKSSPDGSVPARVRYHLVNSLLYALFTTPKGSELVGIDDPAGHPGGFGTYATDGGD